MELKDLLLKFREENGISQREFSRRSGLSNSLISILEMGMNPQTGKKMSPDLETYRKIASVMGITVQALFETLGESEYVHLYDEDQTNDAPRTEEARILAKGIDKLPKAQREQALSVIRAMFAKYADYFEEENHEP